VAGTELFSAVARNKCGKSKLSKIPTWQYGKIV
jgi:hypothetical protein